MLQSYFFRPKIIHIKYTPKEADSINPIIPSGGMPSKPRCVPLDAQSTALPASKAASMSERASLSVIFFKLSVSLFEPEISILVFVCPLMLIFSSSDTCEGMLGIRLPERKRETHAFLSSYDMSKSSSIFPET